MTGCTNEKDLNLAGPCGMYCGTCRHYLARAKGRLAEIKLKHGCRGCREQDKLCAWVKRDCVLLRKKQGAFCFECAQFPCENLKQLDARHVRDDRISLIGNLQRIQHIGSSAWLQEQQALWRCPHCAGAVCVMDRQCYDCGQKINLEELMGPSIQDGS